MAHIKDMGWWIEVAQLVNAASVFILVLVTGYYAYESKKTREAADKQARASSDQAQAAEKTLAFLQAQIEEQTRIAVATLVGSVAELMGAANYWHGRMIQWGAITETVNANLLPSEWTLSLERARNIPPLLYQELQNLQRSSRGISCRIEQFSAMNANYRGAMQATEIQNELAELSRACITVFNKLGPLLPPGLIDGYLDK
jgi:hypothetical protein